MGSKQDQHQSPCKSVVRCSYESGTIDRSPAPLSLRKDVGKLEMQIKAIKAPQ